MTAQSKIEAATLSSAMALAFAEIEGATKAAVNPHFGKKYADLGAVIDAIKPALIKHGLFFMQKSEPSADGVIVHTTLHHTSGQEMDLGKLYVPADKRDAQKFGSALSYARRYSLMTAFGVPAEDDDGNAASSSPRADPVPLDRPAFITDEQRDLIQTLAGPAGKTIQELCASYQVASLKELTQPKAAKLIARLQELAKDKVQ